MRRRTFDVLVSVGGLLLAVVLAVAGGLLLWAHNYANTQVHNQLAMQQITFPTTTSAGFKELPASDQAAMAKYSGQELLTGAQAQTYADHYIAVHLAALPDGGVYSKLSTAARSAPAGSPDATKLQAAVQTSFQGTTLRGLLLEAYAFGTMGSIAGWAAIAAFASAGLMLILSVLGLAHSVRVSPAKEVLPRLAGGGIPPAAAAG